MTILKSNGTWCVQGKVSIIGPSPITISPQQCITVQSRDTVNPAPGQAKNEVQPLECILLYWAIRMTVNPINTPDPSIAFRLLRNSTTPLATIDFPPLTIGVKAQLLNIPIFVNEHYNFEIETFGSGNANFSWMFAGKLSGTDPAG